MGQTYYDFDEVYQATLDYFEGDELAAKVWSTKYALKDGAGHILEKTPEEMHHRIASEIARIEKKYPNPMSEQEVFELLDHFKYIVPQGSPMTGIGNNYQIASLSNCFVIGMTGPSDSYGGIFLMDEEQVQLMKRRGGVGQDLSYIRPAGSPVKNSALTSTGLVSFMNRYSNSTREVAQDGRRGALMLSVSIQHPDSEAFIDAKLEQGKITGANISVRITDEFMRAVVDDTEYTLQYPIEVFDPKIKRNIKARDLWNKIIHNAWKSAEPGVLFWDTIIKESLPDCYADLGFRTISTNPCGEIPLCPYDSCRLLAINLYGYVEHPFTDKAKFNFELFKQHVECAQRIMDDIIDLESEKIDQIIAKIESDPEGEDIKRTELELWKKIRKKTLMGRRTGVGITAEGDMLAALGLRYGTEEATEHAVRVQKTLALSAYKSSVKMACERGAFEIYDHKRETNNPLILRIKASDPKLYDDMVKYGRRNIACLTIAPTGSTSIMTQTTSGIEPVFMPVYKRRRKINSNEAENSTATFIDDMGDQWEEYIVYHHHFKTWMKVNGYDIDKDYSQEEINELVSKSPYYKATSNDVDWVAKVKMQGQMQKWVDHSISVTVNLPNSASEELVNQLYITAWREGCKGCTIYRDGSRAGVLVATEPKPNKENKVESPKESMPLKEIKMPEKRPIELEADIVRFQNNKEKWIAFIGLVDGKPYEIFTGIDDEDEGLFIPKRVNKGLIIKAYDPDGTKHYDFQYSNKRGLKVTVEALDTKFNPEFWNYAKLISGVLRYGMPIDQVILLVQGMELNDESINTWKNGVERALRKYVTSGERATGQKCPSCGAEDLVYQEGCLICQSCGNSKCG